MVDRDKEFEFHLRSLSATARDSNYAANHVSDPNLVNSVKRLYELCRSEKSEELIQRVYPNLNKIFQRSVASISQTQTSIGLLLLAILQFFIDFGDVVLHDADTSLRTFLRSCLSREFADPDVAEATLEFLSSNKEKLVHSFPTLLPQFFPLLLKLIAWNGENRLENLFKRVLSGLITPGSFIPLFPSLVDLPILVVALERVEKSSGPLVGSSIASIQKSAAPEMLLALMDEAYTGSTIADGGADSESEDNAPADPLFLDLLKDENDGLAERHWTSPAMAAALQSVINNPLSNRLREALKMAPRLVDSYFAFAFDDFNDCVCPLLYFIVLIVCREKYAKAYFMRRPIFLDTNMMVLIQSVAALICALIPLVMRRYSTLFPDRSFSYEMQKRLLEFILAAFHRSPHFIAVLKKPVVDRLGEAYDSPAKTELALQLCWAIGEHGGGGSSHKEAARELFESLELLLYENLSSSRLGLRDATQGSGGSSFRKSSQSRLLCFVVTAIAKLATCHRELMPRSRVSLGKVARSRISRVSERAQDYLGLMSEPAICLSVLGPPPSSGNDLHHPGTVDWKEASSNKMMIANVPFYVLGGQQGSPSHEFSFLDIIPGN